MGSAQTLPDLVRFGVFEADFRACELRRNGVKVRLQDLPFRALTLLLSRPGDVITHEEFRQTLWPEDVFVEFDRALRSAIKRLRDALGDNSDNPIFIETIERRGYRWIGPVIAASNQTLAVAAQPDLATRQSVEDKISDAIIETPSAIPPRARSRRKWLLAIPALALILLAVAFLSDRRISRANLKSAAPSPTKPHAANPVAEDLYLQGRYYWNKRTPESLNRAVDAFQQAIEKDPQYADAYVGLADCYNLLREFSAMPPNDAYFKGFVAAKKAVDLAPQSSEAHAALAFVTFWGLWDAPAASKEFQRAIELDPNNTNAHHWYATALHTMGLNDEALREIEIARKLDPNSPSILADKGELLRGSGHREQALQLLRQVEMAEPNFLSPHMYLWHYYRDAGDYPNAIVELKHLGRLRHDSALSAQADAAVRGYAQGGERGLWQSMLSEQLHLYQQKKLSAYFVADSYARLGERQEALHYLQLCVEAHEEFVFLMVSDPVWSSYRSDPLFQQLLAKIGLPQAG
jgi:DNA-binding winged helix-turn-helix (wHTH) protein/cytochrome c-type biogenesis protein CcmH/NrfG